MLNKLPLNDHKTFNYEFHTHTPKSSNRTLDILNTVFWLVVFRVSALKLYSRFMTTRPDVHLSHVFVNLRNCWGRHVYSLFGNNTSSDTLEEVSHYSKISGTTDIHGHVGKKYLNTRPTWSIYFMLSSKWPRNSIVWL